MANHNAADLRQILNLIESIQETPTFLQEWGTVADREKADAARANAAWDPKTKGKLEHKALLGRMKNGWIEWLAKTGKEGNIEDMVQYLNVRVGLEPNDIRTIMGHEDAAKADTRDDNNDYHGDPVDDEEDPETEFGHQEPEEVEPEPTEEPNSYNTLTPAQKAELEANGKVTLPNGKTIWVGKPGDPAPETIRAVKDSEIEDAADYIQNMTDDEFEDFIKQTAERKMKKKDLGRLRDELLVRSQKMTASGDKEEASDLSDLVSRLEKEVGVPVSESILSESKLSKQQVDMILDATTKYVFTNGVLHREEPDSRRRRRSAGYGSAAGYDDEDDSDDGVVRMSSKVRAFLRNNDVTDEMVHSLRETSRRARSLGSFKGAQDHKVLAMIGLAYLKYRD